MKVNLERAADCYEISPNCNWPDAFMELGQLYQSGSGVPKDPRRAVELYTRGIELGNARCECCLGVMYYNGSPATPVDLVKVRGQLCGVLGFPLCLAFSRDSRRWFDCVFPFPSVPSS